MVTALDDRPASPATVLGAHHPVGASTGWLRDVGDWAAQARAAAAVSPFAAELAALSLPEFATLEAWLHTLPPLPFRYLSVHAPVKELDEDEPALIARLAGLPAAVRSIVVHPDVLRDPAAYARVGSRLVIENMDARKAAGQTPADLQPLFALLPEAGFCLDVAHVTAVDPSMELAHELLDCFGARLRQLHVSSLVDGEHVPLTADDAERFRPVLRRCVDVPWLLEAPAG
ncbi:hypothetical protein DSM112329_00609 [Paraconexibacter sp. AEG42_29]|uniref:Uncharacterized protein n=1 Tax=Paraconexibacter sp. AEG42_29 TaxID=2997339 RepID=A0AAU7AQ24_9ACTN